MTPPAPLRADLPDKPPPPSFIHCAAAFLGRLYLEFVGLTTSIRFHNGAPGAGQVIYALWHCQQAFLIYIHRGRGIAALASRSRDGEYAARLLEGFGYTAVRGSTSSGGMRSLIEMMKCAGEGRTLAITPDGPKGPARKAQKGAVYLAQKTGLPVTAMGAALSNKITARSWDRFQIPLPFGRAVVAYSAPFYVAKTDNLDEKAGQLEKILNETCGKAEEETGK